MSNTANILKKRFCSSTFAFRQQVERITAEYSFAERFCALHQESAPQWEPLLQQAGEIISGLSAITSLEGLKEMIARAEGVLAPIGRAAKEYTIHCVGHAHIDMNWQWSFPETAHCVCDTFDTVIRLLDQYPDFKFSQSQCSVYKIAEQYRPDLMERIRELVAAGRWEVTASHWVENDNNLSGGEALCRHLLYSRQYMKHLFGLSAEDVPIAWCPDTFGHAATIPDYLSKGKVRFCYMHRPGAEAVRNEAFFWEGTDGSRILVRNDAGSGYNGVITSELADKMFKFVNFTGGRNFMFVYGVGDHGGGPTRRDLENILEISSYPIFPTVKFSKAMDFFLALEKESGNLPVWKGELNPEFTGCYTTQSEIKLANRLQENRIADAEYAALLGGRFGIRSYAPDFTALWHNCLFQQFHDILPGSCKKSGRDYTAGHLQDTLAETGMAELQALRGVAGKIHTALPEGFELPEALDAPYYLYCRDNLGAGAGITFNDSVPTTYGLMPGGPRPYVLFNPTESRREEVVTVTIWDNPAKHEDGCCLFKKHFNVLTPDGRTLPVQIIEKGDAWSHHFVKGAFPVSVPAHGYAVYTVLESDEPAPAPENALTYICPPHHCFYTTHERAIRYGAANKYVSFEIDQISGGIRNLTDLVTGNVLISDDGHRPLLEMQVEKPHWMSAWNVAHAMPGAAQQVTALWHKVEGPYMTVVEVVAKCGSSQFTIQYTLDCVSPVLRISLNIDWMEKGSIETGIPALRMALPLNLKQARLATEIPFGFCGRELNHDEEVPALRSLYVLDAAGERPAGIMLANDCKYGYALEGNTLRASLLRSPFDPDRFPELGEHQCSFALAPAPADAVESRTAELGRSFNHPLKVIATDCHRGEAPNTGSFLSCSSTDVIFSAVKKAEDGDGIIIRFYTTTEITAPTTITFSSVFGALAEARKVNLMEEAADEECVKLDGNVLQLPPLSKGIYSFRIRG